MSSMKKITKHALNKINYIGINRTNTKRLLLLQLDVLEHSTLKNNNVKLRYYIFIASIS